ncbi:MAG TPA: hypothetical protein VMW13_00745 [Dehalococcoidales bacterium]|nr:hypothetical protein [Dehalococcoidales bacterium]
MADIVSALSEGLERSEPNTEPSASALLTNLVEESAYVGEVYSLGYEEALV